MAQKPLFGFFVGAAGVSFGKIGAGGMNLCFAWDPLGQGVVGMMGEAWQATGFTSGVLGGGRVKSVKPVRVAKPAAPLSLIGKIVHFKLDNPGGAASGVADLIFDVFEEGGSAAVYTASGIKIPNATFFLPNVPIKVKIKGFSTQGELEYQGFVEPLDFDDDGGDGIYENLMTEDSPLHFNPFQNKNIDPL